MQNSATLNSHEPQAWPMLELDMQQLEEASGGSSTEWSVATGTAAALTIGAATVSAPLVAGALAVGGIISASLGIYYAVDEWRTDA